MDEGGREGGRGVCKRISGWMPGKYIKRKGKMFSA